MADNYYPIEFNGDGQFTIYNNGTAPSPCKITIIPMVDFVNLTIQGLSREPIVVRNVLQDSTLVIDGENRTVTLDDQNYFSNYDGWEFPKVQPGSNQVIIPGGARAQVAIEYQMRYI